MKRFICKHIYLLLIPMLLAIVPFGVCFFLLNRWDSSDPRYSAIFLCAVLFGAIGGLLMYLIYRLLTSLEQMDALRYGRTQFSVGKRQTRDEAQEAILARVRRKSMRPYRATFSGSVCPVGIWQTKKLCLARDPETLEEFDFYSLNYLLYSTELLDRREWERIRQDASSRIQIIRAQNQKEKKKISTVASVCILADTVDTEVAQLVLLPQKWTVSNVYVCAAEVPSDRWYVCSEQAQEDSSLFSRSVYSRRLHATLTFEGFPYRGNENYTERYLTALEKAVQTPLRKLMRRPKVTDFAQDEQDSMREQLRFSSVPEGGVRIYGDEVYLFYKGYRVSTTVLTPEEAEEELAHTDEEDGDQVSLQDMLDDMEDMPEPPPSFSQDYRGPIVVVVPTVALEPRLKLFRKKESREICLQIRDSLLSQEYARVQFLGEKKDRLIDLP